MIEAGTYITSANEHLIPFGSSARGVNGTIHKTPSGWIVERAAYGAMPDNPLTGRVLTVGTGRLESLPEFKQRVRTTVAYRILYSGVNGIAKAMGLVESMGASQPTEWGPGTLVSHPYDVREASAALMGTVLTFESPQAKYWTIDDRAIDNRSAGVYVVAQINDAPLPEPEPPADPAHLFELKRLLWQSGRELASEYGWCGDAQRCLYTLGIDDSVPTAVEF